MLPEGVEALPPDVFLLDRLRAMPDEVSTALRKQANGYKDPPASIEALLDWLERDLPEFVAAARLTVAGS